MLRASLPYFGSTLLWTRALDQGGIAFRQNENYQRRSQRNRTVIANSQGRQTLSIPLLGGKHQACAITAVNISYVEDWQRHHWLSIRAAYGKAPFWEAFADELEELIFFKPNDLWSYNWNIVEWVKDLIAPQLVLAKASDWITSIDKTSIPLDFQHGLVPYPQLFMDRNGWLSNLSILDLILCQGPTAANYLTPTKR